MTDYERFLESAKQRADDKGMSVEVYLARQIRLSALALRKVTSISGESSVESVAVEFDVRELASVSNRLEKLVEVEYEA